MKNFLLRITYGIQRKIFMLFSMLAVVLVISLGLVASKYATQVITETILTNLQTKSKYINNTLENYIDEIRNTIFVYSFNLGLADFISNNFHDETERYTAFKDFNNTAQAMIAPKKYCDLFVIIPDLNYIFSTNKDSTVRYESTEYIDRFESLYEEKNIIGSLITEKFIPPFPSEDKLSFSIIQAVPYAGSNVHTDNKGYIIMTSSERYFQDLFKNIQNQNVSNFVMITNDQFDIIYSDISFSREEMRDITYQLEKFGTKSDTSFTASFKDESYIGYVHQSRNTNWRIYFFNSSLIIERETTKINWAIILITGIICLLMLIASYGISQSITTPLRKLQSIMKAVEGGNFNISANITNNDETRELSRSFNQMISHINNLINEVYIGSIHQKEAELYALQQQIKPHFLYNTLGAINSLANMEKYSDIRFAVQKLAEIFRYLISGHPSDPVTISDELQYVNSYIAIQKLRFPDKISLFCDIEGNVLQTHCPRLILQPIIENCVEHTVAKQTVTNINIIVTGSNDSSGTTTLTIKDNGPGIPPAKLDAIRHFLQSGSETEGNTLHEHGSIGLLNVHARLKWVYKTEVGLQLFSDRNGTTVILKFPDTYRKDYDSHAYISSSR